MISGAEKGIQWLNILQTLGIEQELHKAAGQNGLLRSEI
jgi:hypothetical protein